jgi:hypothetical protein
MKGFVYGELCAIGAKICWKLYDEEFLTRLDIIKYIGNIKVVKDDNIMDKRHFNNNVKKWDKIFFSIGTVWYIIFSIFILIIDYLYHINFHDNDALLIAVPFYHILFSWIFWLSKNIFNIPHGDREYILNYYREIYGKIYMKKIFSEDYGINHVKIKNFFVFKEFIDGFLTEEGEDDIIDEIIERWHT